MHTRQSSSISGEQWDELCKRFNQSGLTQKAFCQREGLVIHQFKYHYHRSEHYSGQRRPATESTAQTPDQAASSKTSFRPVRQCVDEPMELNGMVSIRLGDRVQMQCSASVGIEALIHLAREGLS